MPPSPKDQRSPLGLIVLWQLYWEPMHVYRIQKLIEHQGKDRVVNVRSRASIYQAVQRLQRLGLVQVHATESGDGVPDRIVYAITDAGREAATRWLREMLHTTSEEFPEFIVAVSLLFGLAPEDAAAELGRRAEQLARELADTEQQLVAFPHVPRLFLLEEEYRRAVLAAELKWVRGVVEDLKAGRLHWDDAWMRDVIERIGLPPDTEAEA
jgi:DNA-binding PadR family transcriptional regulator